LPEPPPAPRNLLRLEIRVRIDELKD